MIIISSNALSSNSEMNVNTRILRTEKNIYKKPADDESQEQTKAKTTWQDLAGAYKYGFKCTNSKLREEYNQTSYEKDVYKKPADNK